MLLPSSALVYVFLTFLIVHGWSFRPPKSSLTRFVQFSLLANNNDFIDAEIVGEENEESSSSSRGISKAYFDEEEKNENENSRGLLGGLARGIGKLFGGGKDNSALAKRKKSQRKEINDQIDQMFDNAGAGGIGGALLKNIVKGVAGGASDMFAASGNTYALVTSEIVHELQKNSKTSFILGDSISCSMPYQSSTSSMNINGISQTKVRYILAAQGTKGQATVDVNARMVDDETVIIDTLVLITPSGQQVLVKTSGGGGGGGIGGNYNGQDIIDVDAL